MEGEIAVAVKGVIIHKDRALIVQRSADDEIGANTWECAGGKVEFGEGLEDALIREAKEEVGLTIVVDKLLYAVTFKAYEHRQVVLLTYACAASDKVVSLSEEHKNYLWANKEEMMSLLSQPIINDFNHYSVWDQIFTD